jgi:hypothetical protein
LAGQGRIGSSIGHSAGAGLSKWLGFGDYTVSRNTLVTPSGQIPAMHKNAQSIRVMHKEFLGTIQGSTTFTVQKELTLNPGLVSTFPWLSKLSSSFLQYEIKGMMFHYVPTSGNFVSSSPALGAVMIQTSYRSNEPAPSSKSEMLNEYWSSESVPSEPFHHAIECDPKENPFQIHYVRGAAPPTGDSPLLYDIGRTFVATEGMAGTSTVGDLWVTYDIELKKPVVASDISIGTAVYARLHVPTAANPTTNDLAGIGEGPFLGTTGFSVADSTITIARELVGDFYILVVISKGTGFPATSWASPVTSTGCTTIPWNPEQPMNRITFNTTVGGNVTYITYGVAVTKTDNTAEATVTIPDVAPAGGVALDNVIFTVFGQNKA